MDRKNFLQNEITRSGGEKMIASGLEYYTLSKPLVFLERACVNGFVFHGSSKIIIGELLPSQANDEAKETGNKKAVYLTRTPPLAMFTALAGGRDVGVRRNRVFWEITDGGEIRYSKPPVFEVEKPEAVADEGYAYLFDETQADEKLNGEYLSYKPINPLAVIRIDRKDFEFPIEKINYSGGGR